MEPSGRSPSERSRPENGEGDLSRSADDGQGEAPDTRLLEVGFGLYLDARRDTAGGSGLCTDGHPIFEYLFRRPVRDS